jgi:hypothetical protein
VVDVPGLERWLRKVEAPAELCSNEDSAVLEARRKGDAGEVVECKEEEMRRGDAWQVI